MDPPTDDGYAPVLNFSKKNYKGHPNIVLTTSYAQWASFVAKHAGIASFVTASIYQPPFFRLVERHPAARTTIFANSSVSKV